VSDVRHQSAPLPGPKVTIGMPVYNGERFVEEALQSLLGQTFGDFELIVSDNASTDRTGSICRDYAARDPRIHYICNKTNVGFCRNQNRVYQLARGEYFLLAHHDDLRSRVYLEQTLQVMESDHSIVVCYTKTRDIDECGRPLPRQDPPLRLASSDLRERFRDVIRMDHICEPDFGLMRLDVLRETRLHGDYADSDRVLLAELLLRGRFYCIPEFLFFRRAHAGQSTAIAQDRQSRTIWFNPEKKGQLVFPHFRQLREYLYAIHRAPADWRQRLWCCAEMGTWVGVNRRRLAGDLDYAFRQTFRPAWRALKSIKG
jgi:glycosyltransferase involved in cell wall biosynthesis